MRVQAFALVLALLGGVAVPPARACINDRETSGIEREFRSDYGSDRGWSPPLPTGVMADWSLSTLTALGTVLLVSAGLLALQARSKAALWAQVVQQQERGDLPVHPDRREG